LSLIKHVTLQKIVAHDFRYDLRMYVEPYSHKCHATHKGEDNILMEDGRDAHYCLVIYIVCHQESPDLLKQAIRVYNVQQFSS